MQAETSLHRVYAVSYTHLVNNDTNPETKPDASANTDVNAKPAAEKAPEKSLKIVTTIFPEYDWVREVLGDQAENDELTMLLDNGVDLHSYQPTADDIVKISDCDLFIYCLLYTSGAGKRCGSKRKRGFSRDLPQQRQTVDFP